MRWRTKLVWMLATVVAASTAGACVKVAVRTETPPGTDLTTLATYAWSADARLDTGPVDETGMDETLRAVIADHLDRKGYRPAAADTADFHVRYQTAVERRVDEMDLNADQTDRAGWWGPRDDEGFVVEPGVTGQYAQEWDEGLLVVDLLDGRDGRLLYRMTASTRLQLYTADAEERAKRVERAVGKMFAELPAR